MGVKQLKVAALRSLQSISGNSSFTEPSLFQPSDDCPPTSTKFANNSLFAGQPSTIVHRAQFKSRPDLYSIDKGVLEITPEGSPYRSLETSANSGKSSVPRPGDSTGKTSLDSKFSTKSKVLSNSSDKKIAVKHNIVEASSNETMLTPIAEIEPVEPSKHVPTVATVESAANARIFLERYYNEKVFLEPSERSIRRRRMEISLKDNRLLMADEKPDTRRAWERAETAHLREERVSNARRTNLEKFRATATSKYDVLKVLGKGSFGVVQLVTTTPIDGIYQASEQRKEVYAMKKIRKSDMIRNSQEAHIHAERDFLVSAEGSRWIIPLIESFTDPDYLYLVMDFMPGGDFLGLLIRHNTLPEEITRFYIAEMILCVEEAHTLRWIHRDIKPDNFLISASGHLKVSDFGLAFDGHWSHDQAYYHNHRYPYLTKLGISVEGDTLDKKDGRTLAAMMGGKDRHERTPSNCLDAEGLLDWRNRTGHRHHARSVVGTSQYMAPEVVKGKAYDGRCDYWSIGIIAYECLYGRTPFLDPHGDKGNTKANIMDHHATFAFPSNGPEVVSKECRSLIRSLLREPEVRLCSKRYNLSQEPLGSCNATGRYVYPYDAEDIKAHKWFRDTPWETLHEHQRPPFLPDLKSRADTQYFDEEGPVSDFSLSASASPPDPAEIAEALQSFDSRVQALVRGCVDRPLDSDKLRKVERDIDQLAIREEQKDDAKAFVKHYGRKEKKRPRDRCLRDTQVGPKVLELRKNGAFHGYTWRRFRAAPYLVTNDGPFQTVFSQSSRVSQPYVIVGSGSKRRMVWHKKKKSVRWDILSTTQRE